MENITYKIWLTIEKCIKDDKGEWWEDDQITPVDYPVVFDDFDKAVQTVANLCNLPVSEVLMQPADKEGPV